MPKFCRIIPLMSSGMCDEQQSLVFISLSQKFPLQLKMLMIEMGEETFVPQLGQTLAPLFSSLPQFLQNIIVYFSYNFFPHDSQKLLSASLMCPHSGQTTPVSEVSVRLDA